MNKDLADSYALQTIENGGITFNNEGVIRECLGYIVSGKGGTVVDKESFTGFDIHCFYNENKNVLESISNAYIGTWLNDGKIYIDISYHYSNLRLAQRMAINHEQIAFWDLENGEEITL